MVVEKPEAVNILRKKLRTKEIGKNDESKGIYQSDNSFKDHSPNDLSTKLNRLKMKYYGSDGKLLHRLKTFYRCIYCMETNLVTGESDDDNETKLKQRCTKFSTPFEKVVSILESASSSDAR